MATQRKQQASRSNSQINGITLATLKETIQAINDEPDLAKCHFRATNKWVDGNHNVSTISDFYAANQEMRHKKTYELHADEPKMLAGKDSAANPVEHLLNALASCLTTSMVAHAAVRGIEIQELESQVEGDIDLRGYVGLDDSVPKGYSEIRVTFRVKSDESPENLKKLALFSPVFNTITNGANVIVSVEKK